MGRKMGQEGPEVTPRLGDEGAALLFLQIGLSGSSAAGSKQDPQ